MATIINKAIYTNINGSEKLLTSIYDNINGTKKNFTAIYGNIDGSSKQIYPNLIGTPLSSLVIGSTVYMKVNGVSKAFIVVNQGRPSTAYDASCNGTWLMMKDVYESRAWDSSDNDYANSDIHSYLNNTFVNLFDSDIKSVIKQVKIPYVKGTGSGGSLATGSSGISAKVFLLSYTEVGFSGSHANAEGAVLSHFDGAANSDRIGYLDGTATFWWLRSPYIRTDVYACGVRTSGAANMDNVIYPHGVRPALVLPSTLLVDDAFNVIAT